jgi:hypothetical protein
MPKPTHFFVPCAGADTATACKCNILVPLASFFDEQALAIALHEHGWILFCGSVDRSTTDIPLPESIYLAFCPECGSGHQIVNGFVEKLGAHSHDGN